MKSLVIYFSRDGENYAVGNISKGNSEVIANIFKNLLKPLYLNVNL